MKIAVDFGHGTGQDRGAEGYRNEESTVREFGTLVIEGLKKLGHIVYNVTPAQKGLSLIQSLAYRVNMANYYKADLFVSLHLNAFNGEANGCEVEYISSSGKVYADRICDEISKLGYRNRGAKYRNDLYVLRYTSMPAILIESFFCDSKSDCQIYNKYNLVAAIIKGITGHIVDIKNSSNEKDVTIPPIDHSIPDNCYITWKGTNGLGYIESVPEKGRLIIHLDKYNYLSLQDDEKEGNNIRIFTRTKGYKDLI
ncbi:N-acetylmuramoyl-L-alanine amidase [Clostridium tetanomorphum]|uniref:N-acetylmuramoyl-L-alanine amidase n=1 Tax=Clostridium tetanomorphum TaxID=1553 RepID=UPI000448EFBC|nr:N-acetylmuramoyl-L-alanine amidase [Clostridium tetanomorphum]KAJ51108.1 cell wall hydrolase/autolysin [Clostridium tetanomorphum DSM 665]MBP1864464.1 N-acetylmuramoyl-L-alanine amidase [Clostridium tetanomorphum]NRS83005.1 N-acetylmuramoyl-L-alanine amidase [Clostridium tetanomorphum]SQC01043.1 cell wall hydrolase/autolysin [Clostridium tetanomorphum]